MSLGAERSTRDLTTGNRSRAQKAPILILESSQAVDTVQDIAYPKEPCRLLHAAPDADGATIARVLADPPSKSSSWVSLWMIELPLQRP